MVVSTPSVSHTEDLGLQSDVDSLLAVFLRAVSHDLKSPLLTMSLSAELMGDALPGDERARVAREAMTHGIQEMERMLDAVTAVSRARTRILSVQPVALGELLRGQIVLSEESSVDRALVAVDPRTVLEVLAAVTGEAPAEVRLTFEDGDAHLSFALPAVLADIGASPVRALLTSLQQYAGTSAVALAVAEVLLERQGGLLHCDTNRLTMTFPLAPIASAR